MIKFFRKIRYDLMEKNKTANYLKYAIGEIILVVIGILIALQINNWNESRKDFAKSKNYLSEIKKDLVSDTIAFNRAIKSISTSIDVGEWALNRIHDNTSPTDSLWMSFDGTYWDTSINDRTFQRVQNAGDSKFIGFESITDEINYYYGITKKRVEYKTSWDEKEVSENQSYMRDLEKYIEIDEYRMDVDGAGTLEKSFSIRQDASEHLRMMVDFANSTRGRNHFKNNYARHSRLLNTFKAVKETAAELIIKINKELEQTE